MTSRERYLATLAYGARDRPALTEMSFWPETLQRWKEQGLPEDVYWNSYADNTTDAYFGWDCCRTYLPVELGLWPAFEECVLEDRGDRELVRQDDGVEVVRSKHMGSIPHPERHLLRDRSGWLRHYLPRLDPGAPGRIGPDIERVFCSWRAGGRQVPLAVGPVSLFGWIRNWMGLEQAALLIYDEPALFEEMIAAIADCACRTLAEIFRRGYRFDALYYWEDMCYNGGPMISPEHARRFLLPQYRRINELCTDHGVRVILLDSDGRIDSLIPVWLDGGIHCLYPVEVGTCGNDAVDLRARFGRDLRMMGGFDTRILTRSGEEIEGEVRRLAPLVDEGGYLPTCDHYVPPDVPLAGYRRYVDLAHRVWGRGG